MGVYGRQVTLEDILEAKEKRALMQAELRRLYNTPVASITINMPGSVKYNDDTVSLLYCALDKLRQRVRDANFAILEERIYHSGTGPGAVLAVEGDASVIKGFGVSIEEEQKFGRLFDIDVFDAQGQQINRDVLGLQQRECVVCSQNAVVCMRTQAHTQEEVLSAVKRLVASFKADRTKTWPLPVEIISIAALEAMLMEVACTPAPGLVDRFNAGAHKDMDFFTFIKSSSALSMAMHRCAMAGWQHDGLAEDLLSTLRKIGAEAENAMFIATKGVNTQKGILFLMGVLSAAAALVMRQQPRRLISTVVLAQAAAICNGLVQRELAMIKQNRPNRKLTAGERFYVEHGVTGIRGEIEAGLPTVLEQGLPCLREALRCGLSLNDALVHALIGLMSETEDTTILNRHDIDTLTSVQNEAKSIMEAGGALTNSGRLRVIELDKKYSQNGISPGGSADLLAVTYFLYVIEERYNKVGDA
jgi:holo-ACP synthase / triphosphoribosyl-dephospho-CoA synthase